MMNISIAKPDTLKIGDRVTVRLRAVAHWKATPRFDTFHGTIVGETNDRGAWYVKRDDKKSRYIYGKEFCSPEVPS